MRSALSKLACAAALSGCIATCLASACSDAPTPPPLPAAVLQLADRYEALTASMDEPTARAVLDRASAQSTNVEIYRDLFFLRTVIEDATAAAESQTEVPVDLQGSLLVHGPCPGWTAETEPDPSDGFIELAIGVEESRAQRAFAGFVEGCRFISAGVGLSLSAYLELDLGTSLGLGEVVPPLLVRATGVTLTWTAPARVVQLPELHFRLHEDGMIERLVELSELGAGVSGSAILSAHADGTLGLRVREGEWLCGVDRSQPCALLP
jgi:hypothetical protein